jgi:hypothetical protein
MPKEDSIMGHINNFKSILVLSNDENARALLSTMVI